MVIQSDDQANNFHKNTVQGWGMSKRGTYLKPMTIF